MSLNYAELQSRLCARIFAGLAAGLSTGITGAQITSFAASSATAAAAIVADLSPGLSPGAVEFQAQLAAAVFGELANAMTSITGAEITAIATLAVSCVPAIQAAVHVSIGGSATFEAVTLQSLAAAQVFAGLARGLSSITQSQINTIAASAAIAAAAIQAAI